jgi:NADH dehydrogenase
VIIRPSIIFGPEDEFFNRFAAMARFSPVVPLIGAQTRFQPVFVGDVAEAYLAAVEGRAKPGTIYELGGPEVATFRELMKKMLAVIERRRCLVSVPFFVARLKAVFLQLLPKPLLTVDQVRQLARDNIVSNDATAAGRTLQDLGIEPHAMDPILPTYLYRFRKSGQFERQRVS